MGDSGDSGQHAKTVAKVEKILEGLKATVAKAHDQILEIEALLAGENPTREAMGAWARMWKRRYGAEYQWRRPQDPANLKRLAKRLGLDELVARMGRYLQNSDPFVAKQKHPFGVFVATINTYAGGTGYADALEPPPPGDCKHDPPCRSDQEHTRRILAGVF